MGGIAFVDPDPAATDMTIPMTASGFGFCYSFFDYVQSYSNTHWYNKTDEEWCRAMTFEDYVASGYYSLQLFTQTHLFGCEFATKQEKQRPFVGIDNPPSSRRSATPQS